MEETVDVCLICGNCDTGGSFVTIHDRAKQTLVEASQKRKDKKYLQFRVPCTFKVHNACKVMYLRESNIKSARKSSELPKRKSTESFDYTNLCVICTNDASAIYERDISKTAKSSMLRVHLITSEQFALNINNVFVERQDTSDKANSLLTRIVGVDLVDVRARYHKNCLRDIYTEHPTNIVGRHVSESTTTVLDFIIEFIDSHPEECQFSFNSLVDQCPVADEPSKSYILDKLKRFFGDDLIVYSVTGDRILLLSDARDKVLTKGWYDSNKKKKLAEERERIVETAAKFILQDIKSQYYDTTTYPAPTDFLKDCDAQVPKTLQLLLDTLIAAPKKETVAASDNWKKVCVTLAHCIISSVRPRSFISSILLGLSAFMHKKYASRNLIDVLSHLGLCSSYDETVRFEASIVNDPQQYNLNNSHLNFIFDNADHNVRTLDGKNTFHAMGGVMCVTPAASIQSSRAISRLSKNQCATDTGHFGFYPLQAFEKNKSKKLRNVVIDDLYTKNKITSDVQFSTLDLLYFFNKTTDSSRCPNWNGFMENYTPTSNFEVTKVVALPFVNFPPSNYDTIYTVLLEADKKCKANGQRHTFVTFDQPLYHKAQEILSCAKGTDVEEKLSSVILRLGGFHTIMSFLGTIGHLMEGSGLKECFCAIYAEGSVDKALNGHDYSRAVRGHIIVQTALSNLIVESLNLQDTHKNKIADAIANMSEQTLMALEINPDFKIIRRKFTEKLDELKENGPTAQLWVMYLNLVEILKQFLQAERTGQWQLHIDSIQRMLPYFHASGHTLYAKSAHFYVQEMLQLENIMTIDEYLKFTEEGHFTIRRNNKFRSGVSPDMIIEQYLMRAISAIGGLIHARRCTKGVISKWIASMIVMLDICEEVENFTGVQYESSHQHIDRSSSRITRDNSDIDLIKQYFDTHDPFPVMDKIMSISTGIVGDEIINCYRALDVGRAAMKKVIGKTFGDVKFERKSKAVSLKAVTSSIKVNDTVETVDPTLIFQRISANIKSRTDMQEYLTFELAPYPPSLFDETGMRKTRKSVFYENFTETNSAPTDDVAYVIDGGWLLHKVVWHLNESVDSILKQYVNYVRNHWKGDVCVVFDGYPDNSSSNTKTMERSRRTVKSISRDIKFDRTTKIVFSQQKFLANNSNKENLISMLCEEFIRENMMTKVADDDADVLIVSTAMHMSASFKNVVIIGNDTDLLVILCQRAFGKNIYFLKHDREEPKVYHSTSFKYPNLQNVILLLHSFGGCDTTSALYKQGKKKIVKLLNNNQQLRKQAELFNEPDARHSQIAERGNAIIQSLYSSSKTTQSLNNLRYTQYLKSVNRSSFNLQNLPPTEGAATQHSYRVYLQVQKWLGIDKNPVSWGWKSSANGLAPVYSENELIPPDTLKKISCRCTKGCKSNVCSCKKHGLTCTYLCSTCNGETCSNVKAAEIVLDDDSVHFQDILDELGMQEIRDTGDKHDKDTGEEIIDEEEDKEEEEQEEEEEEEEEEIEKDFDDAAVTDDNDTIISKTTKKRKLI